MVRAITLNSFIAYFVFNTFTNIMQYKEDKKKTCCTCTNNFL